MKTGTAPSTNTNFDRIYFRDGDGEIVGSIGPRWYTTNVETIEIFSTKLNGTSNIYNSM